MYPRIFRVLTLATIFSLAVITILPTPALAAATIRLSTDSGEVGDRIEININDFPQVCGMAACIYFSSEEWEVGDSIDDVDVYELVAKRNISCRGRMSTYFLVPEELTGGDDAPEEVVSGKYYIYATYEDDDRIEAKGYFTVRGLMLDQNEGPVGTEVEISGIGFAKNEDIKYIRYDGKDLDIVDGDEETDRYGQFVATIVIPESIAGKHTITVKDMARINALASFTEEPQITIDPTSGTAGDTVEVTGTGFGEEVAVDITFNGDDVTTSETSENGAFTARFNVPDMGADIYDIKAEDADNNDAKTKFPLDPLDIDTGVSTSPVTTQDSPGNVGMHITIIGAGFKTNSPITITYASTSVALTTTSDANGIFTTAFDVPASIGGSHTIATTDGTNTAECSCYMETEAPPVPALLLPEDNSEAKTQTSFDWEDIDDPSGVTYTLQVATKENFTPSSIMLEKEGLTDSEYSITQGEELEPSSKGAPHYWRVKAMDGASNEGGWSTPASFYVGSAEHSSSNRPSWLIHLWWGLGALGAVFFGYWLGRRRAYYGSDYGSFYY